MPKVAKKIKSAVEQGGETGKSAFPGYVTKAPDDASFIDYHELEPFQGDLKYLSEENEAKLLKSIEDEGFYVPVFVWRSPDGKNYLLDGHGRKKVLEKYQIKFKNTGFEVPVYYIPAEDFKDAKTKLLKITSQYQTITQEGLLQFIAEAELPQAEIFEAVQFDAIPNLTEVGDDEVEEDEPPELDETEPPVSEEGKTYQLGPHRVLCGDGTDLDGIMELMQGQKVDLYLTDPPYNVAYEGKTKDALTIQNDAMSDDDFAAFLTAAFLAVDPHLKAGAAFYIFHADSEGYNFRGAVRNAQWMLKQTLVWVKNSMVMGRQDYQWQHEPVLYGWKSGEAHAWYSDRKQTTLLHFDRPTQSRDHPTMKPLTILGYLIGNSSKQGDLVFDNFLGSGSTLIAADQKGRTCFGTELDPRYVDVIRKRYAMLKNDGNLPDNWQELTPAL